MASPSPLHRLIYFHHETARDAAEVLGISERTLSAWLNGARQPSTSHMMKLASLYEMNPAHFMDDTSLGLWKEHSSGNVRRYLSTNFLSELADPERVQRVEMENIPKARRERQKETLKAV
jgi:transcriptional regulator with XRE-family HTH domain